MNVTRKMVDKELRLSFGPLKVTALLFCSKWGRQTLNFLTNFTRGKQIKGVFNEERYIPSKNGGPDIRIRIFKPLHVEGKLPALVYYHGGGFINGNPETYPGIIKRFIDKRPCVVVAPEYRKSLHAPFPAAFDDCYDTLLWVKENADEIGVFNTNLIVAGHSAGGGLTAAVTLKARDTQDVKIAFQMPMYPMLDDRQNTASAKNMNAPAWNSKANSEAWDLYLCGLKTQNQEIPAYASPARNKDYSNFPPTITFVGEFEPFRDETIDYVEALKKAGIPVEFKYYQGCYHGFDIASPKAAVAIDAKNFTYQSFAEYYDRYTQERTG
jgi:acetyl esterase/lipase